MQSDPAHSPNSFGQSFTSRSQSWRLPSRTLEFPRRPLLMGIVNVTPDSFSDGGLYLDVGAAVAHAL